MPTLPFNPGSVPKARHLEVTVTTPTASGILSVTTETRSIRRAWTNWRTTALAAGNAQVRAIPSIRAVSGPIAEVLFREVVSGATRPQLQPFASGDISGATLDLWVEGD